MKFALVAGEASGDALGAGLVRALKKRYPQAVFEGVVGPAMVAAGCDELEPSETLAVFGLIEPLAHLPKLLKLRRDLANRWVQSPPDVFIGIDAPDFNLGLEKRLRRAGIKTVHYVSPSIWAWRPGRIETVRAAADKVLCILPFEEALYQDAGIDGIFVGHPRADSAPVSPDMAAARAELGLTAKEVIAILPGSRKSEVLMLGKILMNAAAHIVASHRDVQFVTPIATPGLRGLIEEQVRAAGLSASVTLLEGDSERAMIAADVVLLASGTAALESALLAKPTVAAYRLGRITYAIVMRLGLLKLKYFTLPNLLTESPLLPEFMQGNARPESIAKAVIDLLEDPQRMQSISNRFAKLRIELAQDTDQRAADAVASLLI